MGQYDIQVIIPVYNNEGTIGRCLESLIRQTYPKWQALIVDDASTDGSAEVIQHYSAKDERFVYVHMKKNGGPARARNHALDLLDAPYTAFLDADDTWEPTMLETLYSIAGRCGADVVQCGFLYELPDGKQLYPKGAFQKNIFLTGRGLRKVYLRMMTGILMNHVCMKLIRTSSIGKLRFCTTLKTAEDLDFCVRLFQMAGSYYYTTDRLYHYYRGFASSLTGGGLPFGQRLSANKKVSRTLAAALPSWGMNRLCFRLLAYVRPYIIICSKVFRTIREKLCMMKKGGM